MKTRLTQFGLLLIQFFVLIQTAHADLGGFETANGYTPGTITSSSIAGDAQFYLNNDPLNGFTGIVPASTYPSNLGDLNHGPDVTRYNAGDSTAGSSFDILDDSGKWVAISGGRLNEDLNAPLYDPSPSLFTRDYIIAYENHGRSGSVALDILVNDDVLNYQYYLDSVDFDGITPTATTSHRIEAGFWFCPTNWDDTQDTNIFGLGALDSAGILGFEVGYTGDDKIQYRFDSSDSWITTSVEVGNNGWSYVNMAVDTLNNTVDLSIQAFDDIGSTLSAEVIILDNAAMTNDLADFSRLAWTMAPATAEGAFNNKNYFDDFDFTVEAVPEPGTALLLGIGALGLFFRRQKRGAH